MGMGGREMDGRGNVDEDALFREFAVPVDSGGGGVGRSKEKSEVLTDETSETADKDRW
jgi:hypothetical protein